MSWEVDRRGIMSRHHEKWLAVIPVLAKLTETLLRKAALRILALVALTLPTFVGPGGGAKSNESGRAALQLVYRLPHDFLHLELLRAPSRHGILTVAKVAESEKARGEACGTRDEINVLIWNRHNGRMKHP